MTRENAISILRQEIIDRLKARPIYDYDLACIKDKHGYTFYKLNLSSRKITRNGSTYPDLRGRVREYDHEEISASRFSSICKKNQSVSKELQFFKTQSDWNALFDQELCAAINESHFTGTFSISVMRRDAFNSVCIPEIQWLLNIYADYKIVVTSVDHNNFHLLCRDAEDKIVLDEIIQPDVRTSCICIDSDKQFFLIMHSGSLKIYACEERKDETFSDEELMKKLEKWPEGIWRESETNPTEKPRAIMRFFREKE